MVRLSDRKHESKSGKTRISALAHPPATGIGRVSGLVFLSIYIREKLSPVLENDNNKEVVPSYKAQILMDIKNQSSIALGMVLIFAQIDAGRFSILVYSVYFYISMYLL